MSGQVSPAKVKEMEQSVQGGVLVKLILFAFSLGAVPLSAYYGTQKYVWNGDSTLAAITAVFAANFVLVAYIIQSVYEDKKDNEKSEKAANGIENRKDR